MKRKKVLRLINIIVLGIAFQCLFFIIHEKSVHSNDDVKKDYTELYNDTKKRELILVNKNNMLPSCWKVQLVELKNNQFIDSQAYPALQDMFNDMENIGLKPVICSSYRTEEKQQYLYQKKLNEYINAGYLYEDAIKEASQWVAPPNYSEHQTGLAVDIVSLDYQLLDEGQEGTFEQEWLINNSWKYGFVLRYPKEKKNVTHVHYEPWHYRYVGKIVAKIMYENSLCLEEYLKMNSSFEK